MLTENLRRMHPSSTMIVYKGFQSASAVVGLDKMQKLCRNISVCTDDGTLGEKGFVTQIFQKDIKQYLPERTSIYACGPGAMLKSLAKILIKENLAFRCRWRADGLRRWRLYGLRGCCKG